MDGFLVGTVVLVIQIPGGPAYIGVDSKVVAIGSEVANADPERKIHRANGVAFTHAGIFRDTHGKIDVDATATASIAAGGNLEQVADRFTAAIEPQLSASLADIRSQNPPYFRDNLKRPLEMLFASVQAGIPQVIVILFEITDPFADNVRFRVTRLRCPGDCPKGSPTTIALGEHAAADQFLDAHPEVLRSEGPVVAIQEAIAHQASVTPDFVSLPAVTVSIDNLGIHFPQ